MDLDMKKILLLGHPVSHSKSPDMQNAAIRHLGLDDSWRYETLDVSPEDLVATLEKLESDPDIVGCNVTVPHKVAVFEWLGPSRRMPEANRFRAVNTLARTAEGRFQGTSTDFGGSVVALRSEAFRDCPPEAEGMLRGRDLAILGTGGSAQTLAIGFAGHGSAPRSISVFGRNPSKASEIVKMAGASPRDPDLPGIRMESLPLPEFESWNRGRESVVIQTTTVGMESGEAAGRSPVPAGSVGEGQIAFDIVYKPHDTPFLREARDHGATIVHGIDMLVGQGALALRMWVAAGHNNEAKKRFDLAEIASVMREALGVR